MRLTDPARPEASASGCPAACSSSHQQYAGLQAVRSSALLQAPAAVVQHGGQKQEQQNQSQVGPWQALSATTLHQHHTWSPGSVDLAQHQQQWCLQHSLISNVAGSAGISSSKWHALQPMQPLPCTATPRIPEATARTIPTTVPTVEAAAAAFGCRNQHSFHLCPRQQQ